jgi:lambda family phage portal protein
LLVFQKVPKTKNMNLIDQIVSSISPAAGVERARLRAIEKNITSATRAYEGATKSRRGDGWNVVSTSENANSDIQKSLRTLRDRSINGYKNNASVFKAIRTIQNGVIGTGIMPTPVAGDVPLTKRDIELLKKEWKSWGEKTNCDFDGFFNNYGLQSLAMRNIAMQGEIFIMKRRDASARNPIKMQVLSPHMVDHTKNSYLLAEAEGNYIVQGVEFNMKGQRVAYWVFNHNPNNEFTMKLAPTRVLAKDMIHVFYKEFPEQVRGIPFGTSTMLSMRDLADYKDAQLMLQKVSACHVVFTTKQESDESFGKTESGDVIDRMEPGMIERLAPGETVTFNNPPTPGSYSEYVSKNQQENAAGFGITYEQFTGDLSKVNFSSGRMGFMEAQRQIEDWQYNMFIPQFCEKIWEWFIEGLNLKMIFTKTADAEWTPQGREMIDPVKEMNGLILELKAGLVSWTEACKRRGYNPDTLFNQIKLDKDLFEKAGVNVEWIIQNVVTPEKIN